MIAPDFSYVSVCSGMEAASLAAEPLGWKPIAFSEVDKAPRALIKQRFPFVPLFGDFTLLRDNHELIVRADALFGGTPCQGFSVAGLRGSLSDDRSNLCLEFVRLANAIDDLRRDAGREPCWILWENVPGVLSTPDNAFGAFLGGLVGSDAPLVSRSGWEYSGVVDGPRRCAAWRTLDAQYFGLAQRRLRVFVLAIEHPRGWSAPDALLPITESLRWHPAPRRETGQRVATPTTDGVGSGGVIRAYELYGHGQYREGVAPLRAQGGDAGDGSETLIARQEIARCVTAREGLENDFEVNTLIAHSLRGEGFDASEDGSGRGTPIIPILEVGKGSSSRGEGPNGVGIGNPGDPMFTLQAGAQHAIAQPYTLAICGRGDSHDLEFRQDGLANAVLTPNGGRAGIGVGAVAFDPTQITSAANRSNPQPGDPCHTLAKGQHAPAVAIDLRNGTVDDVAMSIQAGGMGDDRGLCPNAIPHAFDARQSDVIQYGDMTGPLDTDQQSIGVLTQWAVRRLTPMECERLQGAPDDWTNIAYRGSNTIADGPRYKMIGNSWAIPCVRYIFERIEEVRQSWSST